MGLGNLGCSATGATTVYPAPSFEPLATLEAIAEERCTSMYGVPTMWIAMLEHPQFDAFDLTSLRTGVMAGVPCPVEVMKRAVSDMHVREVRIVYGMTETAPASFMTSPDDDLERRVTTVGRLLPNVEGKVIDPVTGETMPWGTAGEICTCGYLVMRGYWEDADATAAAVDEDGWMHTGDLGVMDAEGFLNIVGRSKDMVIRGGENIYPREIEETLFEHPAVAERGGRRCARRTHGRGAHGVARRARGPRRHRGRAARFLPRAPRGLQGAALLEDRRRVPR